MGTPADPEALAHWLLRHSVEGDDSSVASVAAASYRQLRAALSVFFGQHGFDALWARAMTLVPQSVLRGENVGSDALMLGAADWPDVLRGRTPDETLSVAVAAFTSFIGLLFSFVGAELGSRLLHQIWPELPLDAPSTSTGDVQR